MFGDNEGVVNTSMIPKRDVKKCHNTISCHCVQTYKPTGIVCFTLFHGKENLSDTLTKILPYIKWFPIFMPLVHWGVIGSNDTP